MKKVSTRAAAQSRNICQPQLTIGLDLGDRNSWYCVVDEAGQIQREQRVRTSGKALREVFGAMARSRIAVEIGTHSPWISRLLSGLGHEVIVANARKVRLIGESRKKDDRLDAQTLARLARVDPQLLCPVKHRSAQSQADLTVIRARAGLVRARTSLVNTARGLAKSYGERLRGCNAVGASGIYLTFCACPPASRVTAVRMMAARGRATMVSTGTITSPAPEECICRCRSALQPHPCRTRQRPPYRGAACRADRFSEEHRCC